MTPKTWFLTGTSRGFGREWAIAPPLRAFFGDGPLAIATADYDSRLATWREWEPVSVAAAGLDG
jgi:hypothetical protein